MEFSLEHQAQDVGLASQTAIEEEQCPVCWGLLCEPVSWPECSHQFCLLCMLKTRQRPKPSCPLCRSPAPRASKVDALQVDIECAARVRQSVGFSAYMTQRRKLWAAAVETPEELKAMPIYCTGLNTKHLRFGRRIGLRFSEPRCCEIVKRAMAPGGSRRFAAVTRSRKGEEIVVGARGCLFEIVESSEGTDGLCQVIVETGSACKLLAVTAEEMHDGPPLFVGQFDLLEEEDVEDDEEEDGTDDISGEDEAVVLDEEGQLGLLRERVQLLELLNTAMELEQARLEQRRLELTMLLSQRRLYQELIEMRSELGDLVHLAGTIPRNAMLHGSSRTTRHHPEGIGSTSSASEHRRSGEVHGYSSHDAPKQKARETSGVSRSVNTVTTSSSSSSRFADNQVRYAEPDCSHVPIPRHAGIMGTISAASQFRPTLHTISLSAAADMDPTHQSRGSRGQVRREGSQRHSLASNTFSEARSSLRNAAISGRSSASSTSMRNTQNRGTRM